ncbi:flagellar hook-associated protein 3 [Sphingobium sp. SYK-6]|uniref:flagellin n=1 Tax=Sphingobium sp. (strain NBRC 103272 / SYK-6) TaxID=627192 RepID=UPI00022773A7|nr:flagellin [Sphingobium sp. SYK-6]BAK65994.1 flagellar hook-associated protein 3 [Sphingobium sp. SYK-6]
MVFITTQSINAEILRQQRMAKEIANEQAKVSSGQKINQPSDNPQDWVQISLVGRQQSINQAWQSNLTFAESRATKASTNLNDINNLMTRVTDLLVTSTSTGDGSPGREAVAQELEGIRATINELLNQKDYQGQPVFDETTTVNVPVGMGISVESVPTRQSVAENAVGTKSLDDVLADAIAAVKTGTADDRSAALNDARTALDHVIVAQSLQGVRSQRLENIGDRLSSQSLALTERRSGLADTDLTETITTLQNKLITLEAAQAAFARINRQSLFDLIS